MSGDHMRLGPNVSEPHTTTTPGCSDGSVELRKASRAKKREFQPSSLHLLNKDQCLMSLGWTAVPTTLIIKNCEKSVKKLGFLWLEKNWVGEKIYRKESGMLNLWIMNIDLQFIEIYILQHSNNLLLSLIFRTKWNGDQYYDQTTCHSNISSFGTKQHKKSNWWVIYFN